LSDPAGSDLYTTCKEIRLLGKFQPDSFKTRRLACVETDGQTDMARSTRLAMLIKNIYTLWGRKRMLHCVANFWLKSMYPLQGYNYFWKQFYAWIWEYSFSEPRRLVQELRQLIFKQERKLTSASRSLYTHAVIIIKFQNTKNDIPNSIR